MWLEPIACDASLRQCMSSFAKVFHGSVLSRSSAPCPYLLVDISYHDSVRCLLDVASKKSFRNVCPQRSSETQSIGSQWMPVVYACQSAFHRISTNNNDDKGL